MLFTIRWSHLRPNTVKFQYNYRCRYIGRGGDFGVDARDLHCRNAIGPEVSAAIVAGLVKIALPEHHHQAEKPEDKVEAVAELAETVFEEVI